MAANVAALNKCACTRVGVTKISKQRGHEKRGKNWIIVYVLKYMYTCTCTWYQAYIITFISISCNKNETLYAMDAWLIIPIWKTPNAWILDLKFSTHTPRLFYW